jgi:hypothetical protein
MRPFNKVCLPLLCTICVKLMMLFNTIVDIYSGNGLYIFWCLLRFRFIAVFGGSRFGLLYTYKSCIFVLIYLGLRIDLEYNIIIIDLL